MKYLTFLKLILLFFITKIFNFHYQIINILMSNLKAII